MDEGRRKELAKWGRDLLIGVVIIPAILAYLDMSAIWIIAGGMASLAALVLWENWPRIRATRTIKTAIAAAVLAVLCTVLLIAVWPGLPIPHAIKSAISVPLNAPLKAIHSDIASYAIDSFDPPDWAKKNDDGSPRIFVHDKPLELVERFRSFTDLQARDASKPFSGKWLAVMGTLRQVYEPRNGVIPVMFGFNLQDNFSVVTIFNLKEKDRLESYNPGDHIKAVCEIDSVQSLGITLYDCRVIP
jgi:hypothetical protein